MSEHVVIESWTVPKTATKSAASGLDGTGDLFDLVIAALPPDVPKIVVRYRSPALSRYSECLEAVTRLLPKDGPYVLLGESFSGPIAISLAAISAFTRECEASGHEMNPAPKAR